MQQVQSAVSLAVSQFCETDPKSVLLAFSGGMDSCVLLHALVQQKAKLKSLRAIYIHHGLQSVADDWQLFCQKQCEVYQIPFQAISVEVKQTARQGVESVARQQRYLALANAMQSNEILLTAHHQRDQAETLLLALGRGAGVSGLSGMAVEMQKKIADKVICQARPLLNVPYEALLDYARHFELHWVEDPSNQYRELKRNFVRLEILPKFNQAWPFAEQNIAKSAANLAEAETLLNDLAQMDLGAYISSNSLSLAPLKMLSWARQKNCLRYWLQVVCHLPMTGVMLQWMAQVLPNLTLTDRPSLKLASGAELRVYQQKLYYLAGLPQTMDCGQADDGFVEFLEYFSSLDLSENSQVWLNFGAKLPGSARLISLQSDELTTHKGLKQWFKRQKVAPWWREVWPGVYIDGRLVAIPGFFVASDFQTPS